MREEELAQTLEGILGVDEKYEKSDNWLGGYKMKTVKVVWEYDYFTGEAIDFEHIRQEILQNIEDRGYPVCWKHNVIWEKDMCHLCAKEEEK